MAIDQKSIAAATAVLDYDMLKDSKLRQTTVPRRIIGLAVAGSAAAMDSAVDLSHGRQFLGRFYNLATGGPTRDHLLPVGIVVQPPGELTAIVVDAPATNALNLMLVTDE